MKNKPNPYFLTLDESRKIRADAKGRPGRYSRKNKKIEKIVKESSDVLTARISRSSYTRFMFALNRLGKSNDGIPVAPALEEAILLWMAYRALYARQFVLVCSNHSMERNKKLLARFKRRRRTGAVGPKSMSYSYGVTTNENTWSVTVNLPPVRDGVEKRLKELMKIFKAADVLVGALDVFPIDWENQKLSDE